MDRPDQSHTFLIYGSGPDTALCAGVQSDLAALAWPVVT